ncbi:hypothetical protein LEP1GSC188_4156 [Leptospira weilii serovar Topaz str. LT2116]|uniref:Uncharacterized protein n=1 Tax=Leptospira weilii serovar Topaz str. LT2116 TaxID=1088540 RepID=M3GDF9_9LEPT|nr:hypothetical protein LEP1GSC188_4156 [Leptospira weilii serovar Topaz str. LT2116]
MKFENPNSFLQNQIELFFMVFEFGLRFTSEFKQILFLLIPTQWSSINFSTSPRLGALSYNSH